MTTSSPSAPANHSSWTASRQPPKYLGRRWSLGQAGVAHLVVCGMIFAAGVKTQANLLFWGLGLMVGAMAVSVVWSWLVMRRVELVRLLPDHAVAGQELTLRYRVASGQKWLAIFNLVIEEVSPTVPWPVSQRRRWFFVKSAAKRPPFAGVLWQSPLGWIVHLGPKQTAQAQATSWPLKRGRLILGPMRLSSSFPFGIIRCTLHFDQPDYVLVYPELHRMNRNVWHRLTTLDPAGHLLVDRAGGAEEFFGLRRYRSGDSLRSIDWRHSAKTGQLISREMTQPSPPRVMILLDLSPPSPPPSSPSSLPPSVASSFGLSPEAGEPFGVSDEPKEGARDAMAGKERRFGGRSRGRLWRIVGKQWLLGFKAMVGLANESECRLLEHVKSHGRPAAAKFTHEQLQERAIALAASLVCGAHLQGYQVGLVVVGGWPVAIRAHHSLPHRHRLLETLSLLQTPRDSGDSAGGSRPSVSRASGSGGTGMAGVAGGVGGLGGVVVTASPSASRSAVGKSMHLSADRMEDYIKPTPDHGQLLARSVQPAARHRRRVGISIPLVGRGGVGGQGSVS